MPSREAFSYTFDNLANVIDRFTEVVGFCQQRSEFALKPAA
jgi:hypothetical protein